MLHCSPIAEDDLGMFDVEAPVAEPAWPLRRSRLRKPFSPEQLTTDSMPMEPAARASSLPPGHASSSQPLTPNRSAGASGRFCRRPGLHVSPRGEAKCVRGTSGLGASRAEEKGARRRSGRIASFALRITKCGPSGSLAVRHFFWSEPSPRPWFSRDTNHGLLSKHGLQRARRKPARIPRFSRDARHETRGSHPSPP